MSTDWSKRGLKPASVLASKRDHGDRLRYIAGCRCDACRRANTEYEKARARARKAGDWNGIVSADKARAHMLKLSRQGVGRRAVQAATDIADSILHAIRTGDKQNIRARTERLILAVTGEMASGSALISAGQTWKLIEKLLAKGYTKTQIAQELGSATPALQLGKKQVTVRTAYDVRRLFSRAQQAGFKGAAKHKRERELAHGTYSPRPGVLSHRMGA